MNRKSIFYGILCNVVALLIFGLTGYEPIHGDDAQNVAQNVFSAGSFNSLTERDFNNSWTIDPAVSKSVSFQTVDNKSFLRITNDDATKTVNLVSVVTLDPSWHKLRVSTRIRTKEFVKGNLDWNVARVSLRLTDSSSKGVGFDGNTGYPPEQPQVTSDSPVWTDVSVELDIPTGAVFLVLQPGLYSCTGTADFDEIKVEVLK